MQIKPNKGGGVAGGPPLQLITLKQDENIWVYLAKKVLNISDFCPAEGIFVDQAFNSSHVGVCTPLKSLQNYTVFDLVNKKMTYSEIGGLW